GKPAVWSIDRMTQYQLLRVSVTTGRPAGPTSMKETAVAKDSSFDIVSTVDRQEVDNAVNQTAKEISQRYDFKGVGASIAWNGTEAITMKANAADRVRAVLDVFQSKLIRRGVSLKAVDTGEGEPEQSGQEYRLTATLREGLAGEQAKKITKIIRDQGPKGVKTQINGEEVRVSGKKRDDLQAVIALLKESDIDAALQFINYR